MCSHQIAFPSIRVCVFSSLHHHHHLMQSSLQESSYKSVEINQTNGFLSSTHIHTYIHTFNTLHHFSSICYGLEWLYLDNNARKVSLVSLWSSRSYTISKVTLFCFGIFVVTILFLRFFLWTNRANCKIVYVSTFAHVGETRILDLQIDAIEHVLIW